MVIEKNISKRELQDIVREYKNNRNSKKRKTLIESRGLLNIYRLKPFTDNNSTTLCIDLGCRMYINKLETKKSYKESDLVQVNKNSEIPIIIEENDPKTLYTYKGYVYEKERNYDEKKRNKNE